MKCKCCLGDVRELGSVDFNKSCNDRFGPRTFPVSDIQVPYYKCDECGFVFTDFMDSFTAEDWKSRIYNDDYILADAPTPGFENAGQRENPSYKKGEFLASALKGAQKDIRILDYGSGGDPGDVGLALIEKGFWVWSYDPWRGMSKLPDCKFDFIICNYVIEHCHNVEELAAFIANRLARDGLVYVETCWFPSHPYDFMTDQFCLESAWTAPRNGHVSMFTPRSMGTLMRRYGMNFVMTLNGPVIFKSAPRFNNSFITG